MYKNGINIGIRKYLMKNNNIMIFNKNKFKIQRNNIVNTNLRYHSNNNHNFNKEIEKNNIQKEIDEIIKKEEEQFVP